MIRRHIPVRRLIFTSLVLMGLLGVAPAPPASAVAKPAAEAGKAADAEKNAQVVSAYGKLPLYFIQNDGQVDKKVKFYEKGSGHATYFTKDGVYLSLVGASGSTTNPPCLEHSALPLSQIPPVEKGGKGGFASCADDPKAPANSPQSALVKLIPLGANKNPRIVAEGMQEGKVNYFVGNDPKQWKANVPTYQAVVYQEIYPGIDMKFYGNNRQLEYDIIVKPGADPSKVKLAYEGIEGLRVTEDGDLEIALPLPSFLVGEGRGEGKKIFQKKPIVYQEIDGKRVDVAGQFKIHDPKVKTQNSKLFAYSFEVASYDSNQTLIIDPILIYSTYLGGSLGDSGYRVAVDSSGSAYVTGSTRSSNFPTTAGAYDTTLNGGADAFVVKLNPSGTGLAYAAYLGGSSSDDYGYDIAVDGAGNAYVTGMTYSANFPTTSGAYDTTFNGGTDAFVVKLNSSGSGLVYATYLGGSGYEESHLGYPLYGIAVDGVGNAYVTGVTYSFDFPTTPGTYDTTFNGGSADVFVVKLNSSGAGLLYSTFLGGAGYENSFAGIAVDGAGNAYVAGRTRSANFPTTAGAYDTTFSGAGDVFVVKLDLSGSGLLYATFLGGSDEEYAYGIAVDGGGNAYVTGNSDFADFPTTPGAYDTTYNSGDGFVVKLNPSGSGFVYATFLGGLGSHVAADLSGNAYVTGATSSANFPTTPGAYDTTYNGGSDAFVVKLDPSGTGLLYATYLGGSDQDYGYGIAVDGSGSAYVTGATLSAGFPTTSGAYDTTFNGGAFDAFAVKISTSPVNLPRTGQTTCYNTFGAVVSCAGTGQDGGIQAGVSWTSPRFTDHGDGTVTDNLTGLMWTKDGNAPGPVACSPATVKTWQGALDYVTCLNANAFLGYVDWHLPNVNELESLVNLENASLAVWLNTQGFNSVQPTSYWSSTTTYYGNSAWLVDMNYGYKGMSSQVWSYSVWPVRSGQTILPAAIWKTGQVVSRATGDDGELQAGVAWPNPRFTDNVDGTITDDLTGLMWTKDGNAPGPVACSPATVKTWQGALDYVACLNTNTYLGYTDWRLPNRKELYSLADVSRIDPSLPSGHPFLNVQPDGYYLSSTTFAGSPSLVWQVHMRAGNWLEGMKWGFIYVWPVRSGLIIPHFDLTVTKTGSGIGSVTSSPSGINCGAVCSASYDSGAVVTLTATPDGTSTFTGWSGACTGTGSCTVTMSAAQSVTATFTRIQYTLSVTKAGTGGGTVTSSPAGITCGVTCSAAFDAGMVVTLTATPDATSTFAGWSGACTGTGTCTVTMDAAKAVTATFTRIQYTLSVSRTGTGGGTVTSSPVGITCGATCSASYDSGTVVTLTATPDATSTFTGWSGACTGTGTCSVTMSAAQSVTATFTRIQYTLSVTKVGTGGGTVTSSPAGITCGATCSAAYDSGTVVTLTATPDATSTFTGWSGACTGTGTCSVTMSAAQSVTATFTRIQYTLSVSKAGTGGGTVTSSPAGITCGATCSALFDAGTVVTLTATPDATSTFGGWSGACAGTGTCVITMTAAQAVTAAFTRNTYNLTVSKTGTGAGTVTSSTSGTPIILATGVDCLDALVIDSTDVYFADNSCTYGGTAPLSLKRVAKDGGTVATIFSGSGNRGISSISLDNVNAYFQYNGYGSAPIVQVPKSGGTATTLASATDKLIGVIGSNIYYSTGFCCIYKVPINGGTPTQVLGGGNWVRSSAVDSTNIYFVEYFSRDVRKVDVASGALTTLISGNSTEGSIFIDSNNVYLNLDTLGTQSIKKVSKNGGPVTTIVDNNSNAFGFVSDDVYIYFTENGDLKKVSVNGGTPTLLLPSSNITLGGDGPLMVVDNLYLYWRENSGVPGLGRIMRMSKSGGILPGIDCGVSCSASFDAGTVVVLTPTPNATSTFTGWSGACSGTGTCMVTMDSAKSVTATFTTIQYALSASKTGTGGGTVASSPAGITCGATCSASFDTGTVVTLTATPDGASTFAGWSGACTGMGSCIVTMDAAKSVTATFTLIPYSLSVSLSGTGGGVVTSSPAGINCGATCGASFAPSTVVTLTATPDGTSTFTGWSGACSGTGSCVVTMDAGKSVTATFTRIQYALSVSKTGTGGGTVTSTPPGINCGASCSASVDAGTVVTLTPTPDATSNFTGWSGACSGTGACAVTMNSAQAVTATFTRNQYTLTVSKTGTGGGTVTSSPLGINCGATCSAVFDAGTVVALTATPDGTSTFDGWSGACSGSGTCTVTMDAPRSVTATFTPTVPPSKLSNISTRAFVGTGTDAAVGGFIISGTGTKQVLIRGFGPTLSSFGVVGALANPTLELSWDNDGNPLTAPLILAINDNWGTVASPCNAPVVSCGTPLDIANTGMSADTYAPTNPDRGLDAALLVTLPPGLYTVSLSGVSNGTGVGLIGVDDVDTNQTATLVNISTRAYVGTGTDAAVGGFIISGTTNKQVLIRGFGPTLSSFGVSGALGNPTLELSWDDDGNPLTPPLQLTLNNDWGTPAAPCNAPVVACGTPTDIANTGMSADTYAPTNANRNLDAALLVTLPPGLYTVSLSGVSNGTGVGLIGVDQVGP